ncbi:MAG: RHS repeat-associated core domain-containing protein [Chlamydiota bacterium]
MHYRLSILFCFLAVFGCAEDGFLEELFLSTPDQLSTLVNQTGYLAGGLVSPMSGQLCLRQTDLIVKGAQDIPLTRIYIPPQMPSSFVRNTSNQEAYDKKALQAYLGSTYKGWQFFPHLRLQFNLSSKEVRLSDPNGATFDFRLEDSQTVLASPSFAISNVAGEEPSGKYDPRNTRIFYDNGDKIIVYAPDGTIRWYIKSKLFTRTSYLFLLQKEILPNGKVLKIHYDERGQPIYLESLDPKERYVYASLRINRSSEEESCHFISSSSTKADYIYERRVLQGKIKEKTKKGSHKEEFNLTCPPILTSVSSPFYRKEALAYCGRFLLASYSGKDHIYKILHGSFGEDLHYRVEKIYLPVGLEGVFEPVYELNYYPPIAGKKEGATHVKNNDGTSTYYHFSKDLFLTSIKYVGRDGRLQKEKTLSYDEHNWLESISFKDGEGKFLTQKNYKFDDFGNPISEIFTGNLSGNEIQENYTIKRDFSQDGKNLLLKEEQENGKVVCLSYLPGTNLVTVKLTKDHETIILREFFIYDDCYNLVQKVLDDGRGEGINNLIWVTQRTFTKYALRQQAPFLHMQEWVEEGYLDIDTGSENLLEKRHLLYDDFGNVSEEEVYDAKGELAYILHKEYNERGDLLSETNPLGHKASYGYDLRGHLDFKSSFSKRLQTIIDHDRQGRSIKQTERGDDGITQETLFDYDFQDRLIQKIDSFENSIQYSYDPLVNKVCQTDFPERLSLEGKSLAVITFATHDSLGRELTKTDANGNTVTYRYGAYGFPLEINYPNGGKEIFRYEKNGALASHIDVLGRVLSKIFIFAGKIIAEEIFTYSGFNLLTETDKEGYITRYFYDGAGRKIREERLDRAIDFTYDALGRLEIVCKHNGENTLFIQYERDLMGNLLGEYKILYTYDQDGNRDSVTRYINDEEAVDKFTYDSLGRVIRHENTKSYVVATSYNENRRNSLGQRVLEKVTLNPKSIQTVETSNPFGQVATKEISDYQGRTLSSEERIYDPHGNLTYQKDHVYEEGRFKNTKTVQYTYISTHHVESLTKAFGTKEANITTYSYGSSENLQTKTLPNGTVLSYDYHPLGPLDLISSSNGEILHSFVYDKLGHLKQATDERLHLAIYREVDPFGNVLQESFPNGLEVIKQYDALDRLTYFKMANVGEVLYKYDSLFLKEVTRFSSFGKLLYTHQYEGYDIDGNLTSERLIGDLGQVIHKTETRSLKTAISSPYFNQYCDYDSLGDLTEDITDGESVRFTYDGLSQLSSEEGFLYVYDSLYNRTKKNGLESEVNNLNQLVADPYDLNGNQILTKTCLEEFVLTYDPLNRLTEATSDHKKIIFSYDPLGRSLSKTLYVATFSGFQEKERESYLYQGQNEVGAFSNGKLKNLRILGLSMYKDYPRTVGIELEGQIFAPILDVQGNIRRLIDLDSKAVFKSYDFTAFGEALQKNIGETPFNPWRFASKRWDPNLHLIYFGKRYYDPVSSRWLTTDPAGFMDSVNLYQYVLNNPFKYLDPQGENLLGFVCGIAQILVGGLVMASGVGIEIATLGGYTIAFGFHESVGLALMTSGCAQAMANVNDISLEKRSSHLGPDFRAEGNPHTIIERPGPDGQYTTHNEDGTFKQYRGSGKPHGDIPRPNIKENKINPSPSGPRPGNPDVRPPRVDEVPKGN